MVYHQNDRKADHAILDGLVGKCTLFVLDKQPYYPMLKYTIIYDMLRVGELAQTDSKQSGHSLNIEDINIQ
jgi:hypothetical protein